MFGIQKLILIHWLVEFTSHLFIFNLTNNTFTTTSAVAYRNQTIYFYLVFEVGAVQSH